MVEYKTRMKIISGITTDDWEIHPANYDFRFYTKPIDSPGHSNVEFRFYHLSASLFFEFYIMRRDYLGFVNWY